MNSESSASVAATLSGFKKFVTEEELEEKRRERQAEWEKVRTPDQPLEAPEEVIDTRSLYDKLQEQKDKKQEEYEEQFALKNQIKGLDKEETDFLDFVSNRQEELLQAREKEDFAVLSEYRQNVQATTSKDASAEVKKISLKPQIGSTKGKSQLSLLAGAVKRKSSENKESDEKRSKPSGEDEINCNSAGSGSIPIEKDNGCPKVVAILPGLGEYTDSSESECSSSDSEIEVNAFPKKCIHVKNMNQVSH